VATWASHCIGVINSGKSLVSCICVKQLALAHSRLSTSCARSDRKQDNRGGPHHPRCAPPSLPYAEPAALGEDRRPLALASAYGENIALDAPPISTRPVFVQSAPCLPALVASSCSARPMPAAFIKPVLTNARISSRSSKRQIVLTIVVKRAMEDYIRMTAIFRLLPEP
jgi:hypothetical protein